MSDRSENTPQPEYLLPVTKCPTPADWEQMLGPEGIQQSFDDRLNEHVEHCAQCRDYLENRSTEPGLSLAAIASVLPDVVAARPMNLSGISVPEGYVAAGSPVYGGRGLVFKAIDIVSGRAVAIKMSKYRHETNQAERQALEHEAAAVQSLSHPNIVHIYEVLAENDPPAIIMEWVDGGTLQEVLKNHRPSIDEIVQLMKQMADAVSHAHKHLVLHRDIKPSNILMAGDDFHYPKLSDFGLAKLGQEGEGWSTATEFIGTPVYMAPESFRKERNAIGPTVDIYSLGAVLYRLLSGKVPFEGTNPIELGMRVVQEEVTPIRQFQKAVPKDLEKICLKCLRKEPEERYQDAAALKSDLVRFEEGKPVRASRDGTITRWRRWARRDPKAARQAAAFGVFLIGVIIALAVLLRQSVNSERKAVRFADLSEKRLSDTLKAMGDISPVIKRILGAQPLKDDEYKRVVSFIKLRATINEEPMDLKERLKYHYLKLELADSLSKIPGYQEESIQWAKLARVEIKRFINENAEKAAIIVALEDKSIDFRETLLEMALIQYSYACSQIYNAYPEAERIGIGVAIPDQDPTQSLLKEAVASAERVMQLNPKLSEPKGQIADYYRALAENAIAMQDRDKAVEYLKKALPFSDDLREEYMDDRNRWVSALWHRQFLAMAYLEPPAQIDQFINTFEPLETVVRSDRFKALKNRIELEARVWLELRFKHLPLAATQKYQEADAALNQALELFPKFNSETIISLGIRHILNIVKVDRLSLLKLMGVPKEQIEADEQMLSLEFDQMANSPEKAVARAYFEIFRPTAEKRSPMRARLALFQIRDKNQEHLYLTSPPKLNKPVFTP